ncbi:MAG: hypothetical protein RSP_02010 [Rhodanobacter sp.]
MTVRQPLVSLLALCLAACASTPAGKPANGESSGTVSVPLALGETSSGGEPLDWKMPSYPAAMRQACPALEAIDVSVRVDAAGRVSDVIGIVVDMALPPWDAYFAAVRPAVMQWRFWPLRVDHWAADAAGTTHAVDGSARPFEREYAFDFVCRAGKTSVSVRARGGARPR